jgi:hypothetical protein
MGPICIIEHHEIVELRKVKPIGQLTRTYVLRSERHSYPDVSVLDCGLICLSQYEQRKYTGKCRCPISVLSGVPPTAIMDLWGPERRQLLDRSQHKEGLSVQMDTYRARMNILAGL